MRTITLEEHFATSAWLDGPGLQTKEFGSDPNSPFYNIPGQLLDLAEGRIAAMDKAGIDMQILSLNSPGVEQLTGKEAARLAKDANERLAEAIAKHPTRFAGFATIPTADPEAAVTELEKAIKEYTFKGVNINGHVNGRYLDDPYFSPILECAEKLSAPIYIHPTKPPQPVVDAYYSGFSPFMSNLFSIAGWGWHIETAIHVIRIILGGVFDKCPNLQVIIGHMGESIPFMIPRMDATMTPERTKLKNPISHYLKNNVWYTFSGFNYTHTFNDLLGEIGVNRMMFSADYPYASMEKARQFLDNLPVSEVDRHRIAHGNAEQLLSIK
jgi:predicted TIM-barrel fold metal-dependent hydrolase